MKYTVTYTCGHTGRVELFGKSKDRDWKLKNMESDLCPDCYRAQQEENNKKIAEELGLPDLIGSEKQIAWANTLRTKSLEEIQMWVNKNKKMLEKDPTNEKIQGFVKNITDLYQGFAGIDQAKFWIDNRGWSIQEKINWFVKEREQKPVKETEKETLPDDTVYPEENKTKAVTEIIVTVNRYGNPIIAILSPKDPVIIAILKKSGFRWDEDRMQWILRLGATTGTSADRMADIGNALLSGGVGICIHDKEIRDNAVSGNFEARHHRWILNHDDKNVKILYERGADDIYEAARKLPLNRYNGELHAVTVSAKSYSEIRDFANVFGFKISPNAEKILEAAQEKFESTDRVNPESVERELAKKNVKDVLKSSTDILPDLKD